MREKEYTQGLMLMSEAKNMYGISLLMQYRRKANGVRKKNRVTSASLI